MRQISSIFIVLSMTIVATNENNYFFSFTSGNVSGIAFYIPFPNNNTVKKGWYYFQQATFTLPIALDFARTHNQKFLLIIPDCLENSATTSEYASLIEGSRVSLAWVSAYFRLSSNFDARVLLYKPHETFEVLTTKISPVFDKKLPLINSPEKAIKARLINSEEISAKQYPIQLTPISSFNDHKEPILIRPPFNSLKKRILITGGAGFIGSHLTKAFLERNYQVIVIDNLSCCTGENIKFFSSNPDFAFFEADISNPFDIEGPIDIVIHLASIPSPSDYYRMPLETLRSGLHGTKETMELALKKHARYFFSSTSEVYGDPTIHPQPETYAGNVDPIGKRSQYDQSKRGAETLLKLYFEQYHLDIRIARIFNTFGPGMRLYDGRVITNFIAAALNNKPITIYGSGNQTRSLIYISDMINGLVKLIESETIASYKNIHERIFNIGSPQEFSIEHIAQMVNQLALKYTNKTVPINYIPQFDETDPKIRQPDITYINKILGYTPSISFEQGLEKTFVHYMSLTK